MLPHRGAIYERLLDVPLVSPVATYVCDKVWLIFAQYVVAVIFYSLLKAWVGLVIKLLFRVEPRV